MPDRITDQHIDELVEKRLRERQAELLRKEKYEQIEKNRSSCADNASMIRHVQRQVADMAEGNEKLADSLYRVETGQMSSRTKARMAGYAVGGGGGVAGIFEVIRLLLGG